MSLAIVIPLILATIFVSSFVTGLSIWTYQYFHFRSLESGTNSPIPKTELTTKEKNNVLNQESIYSFSDYLQNISKKEEKTENTRKDNIGDMKLGDAELRMEWQTPVFLMNIASLGLDENICKKFNGKLAEIILSEFKKFCDANKGDLKIGGGHLSTGPNQGFYDWQMAGGWDILANHTTMQLLNEYLNSAADAYLQALSLSHLIPDRTKTIQAWATVHSKCVSHLPHCHPGALISGTYYVKIPKGAGKIIFDDPRGPRPPFDTQIAIQPKEGDLLLFPPWLIHQVAPTEDTQERISIAFNIDGDWSQLSGFAQVTVVNTPVG